MLLKTPIVLCTYMRKVMATLKPYTGELAMTADLKELCLVELFVLEILLSICILSAGRKG